MNESQKEKQKELLSEGSGCDCCVLAKDVPGADIQALQSRVMEIGDGDDCCEFAINIPGADIPALQARVLEIGNALSCSEFAMNIPGPDVDVDALIDRAEALQGCAWELHDG